MKRKVKLSIIIPVYNVEKYIYKCIHSIVSQSMKDIEIIVVDDGSTDNSINIINTFIDSRIKVVTKSNGGLSSARNAGIDIVNGEYILFVDSDDYLLDNSCLEEMYNLAVKHNSDILVGNALVYYSEKNNYPFPRKRELFVESTMNSEEFLIKFLESETMFSGVCLNMYKLELIKKVKFKEGILHEDEEFTPRIFLLSNTITIYPKEFYCYVQREGSITKKIDRRKNSKDLIDTCLELNEIYNSIQNNKLKNLLLDNLTTIFLRACKMSRMKNVPKGAYRFIIRNSRSVKNRLKVILFIMNKNLYYKINDIKNNEK